jgi:hypothetical protein
MSLGICYHIYMLTKTGRDGMTEWGAPRDCEDAEQ